MCVRYDLNTGQLVKWSQAIGAWVPLDDWLEGKDVFPGYDAPIVILEGPNKQLVIGNWMLVPSWTDDPKYGRKWSTYNARSEGNERYKGIENSPTFRDAFKKRRCIIPASGFFERFDNHWQRLTVGSQDVLGLAGIWEPPKFGEHRTFAMVTTEPNLAIAKVHDRMPVILHPESFNKWLDPAATVDDLHELMVPYPADEFMIQEREAQSVKKAREEKDKLIEPAKSLFDE